MRKKTGEISIDEKPPKLNMKIRKETDYLCNTL